MATLAVLPPHVAVAHQLIGMCHHGIDPANRHQAIERAQQLAERLDRAGWTLIWGWVNPGQRHPYNLSGFMVQVRDCLAGIAIDADRDPFDGIDNTPHGHITNKADRATAAAGIGRTPPEAA